jgi:hypothetical protein
LGILWEVIYEYIFISGFQIYSSYITDDFLNNYFSDDYFKHSILVMDFSLSSTDTIINVVYEKITVPMAQFMSMFNTILIIGIIGMLASESRVFEELM